ncbi:MAG: hypothetical protein ACXW25_13420, partial [Rhodospirillales bacterium]
MNRLIGPRQVIEPVINRAKQGVRLEIVVFELPHLLPTDASPFVVLQVVLGLANGAKALDLPLESLRFLP